MKISAPQIRYESAQGASRANTSFKGGYAASRELTKQIAESSPKAIKFLTNLGKNNGEILNTIVTAIGTACVAPIFIAFNPLSKEDKETKIYSALRQPISAVIALVIQIGVNTKFNNWLDKLSSTSQLDRADLGAKPQASYLKKILKMQHPKMTKEELNAAVEMAQDQAFWEKVNVSRLNMKDTPIDYKDLVDSSSYKAAKKEVEEKFASQISTLGKKEAKAFIEDKTMELAAKGVEKQINYEAGIKHKLAQYAASGKTKESVMEELTSNLDSLKKTISDAGENALKQDKDNAKVLADVIEKMKSVEDFKQVKNIGKNFDEILQSVKIKKWVKTGINNAEDVLKSSKKWGGIVLSLLTLPVSCGLLNWAYPRIMEKLMPEVVAAKKAKGAK